MLSIVVGGSDKAMMLRASDAVAAVDPAGRLLEGGLPFGPPVPRGQLCGQLHRTPQQPQKLRGVQEERHQQRQGPQEQATQGDEGADAWWACSGGRPSPSGSVEVRGLSATLEQLALVSPDVGCAFRSAWPPAAGIAEYVTLLHRGFGCSDECFVTALVYMDRIMRRHPEVAPGLLTCHRLLAACLTLAAKFLDDECCSTAYSAGVCGVSEQELCRLERSALRFLRYRLAVHPTEYERYRVMLCNAGGGRR